MHLTRSQKALLAALILIGMTVFGVCLGVYIHRLNDVENGPAAIKVDQDRLTARGGIVTNGHECSAIGKEIYHKGGSVVDIAIATMLCEGVAMPQSTGIGGGFFATIYLKGENIVETLDAREVAPLASTKDMYKDNQTLSQVGGLAVAVPGELKGYEVLHERYGKLPWKELFVPTINLCRKGHLVTPFLHKLFNGARKELLKNNPSFRAIYVDPDTGEPWQEGQFVKRLKLANTLEVISTQGADALYNGVLTQGFIDDIKKAGGIITKEDLVHYKPVWYAPIDVEIGEDRLYTFPLPGSGAIMGFIMNILDGFLNMTNIDVPNNWQRIIESFKFGYGKRTLLGDPIFVPEALDVISNITSKNYADATRHKIYDYKTFQNPDYYGANTTVKEDHGTAHVSILLPNGDAISITGTINLIFGAELISESTGIILNDEMDDFASDYTNYFGLPSSPANHIEPGKRPLSSMCPSIIVDKFGDVKMVVGAAGGTKITTITTLVAIRHLWFNQDIKEAVFAPRMHHQLFPMEADYESDFNEEIVKHLEHIGHKCTKHNVNAGFAAITAITNRNGLIDIAYDKRRSGSTVYLP